MDLLDCWKGDPIVRYNGSLATCILEYEIGRVLVLVTSTGHALQVIIINLLDIWERYDALCFCVKNWCVLFWWLCVAICFAGRC